MSSKKGKKRKREEETKDSGGKDEKAVNPKRMLVIPGHIDLNEGYNDEEQERRDMEEMDLAQMLFGFSKQEYDQLWQSAEKKKQEEDKKRKKQKPIYKVIGGDTKDLTIKKIVGPAEVDLPFETHGVLPKPPFRLDLIAPPNSGKTTSILNMIIRKSFGYRDYFGDEIHIWSPTLTLDPSWSALPDELLKHARPHFDMMDFQKAMDEAKEDVEQNGKTLDNPRLFIIDDSMSEISVIGNTTTPATDATSRGRHFNVSIIYVAQCYKKLAKAIRTGTSNIGIWKLSNAQELRDVWKEHGNGMDLPTFTKICNIAWAQPYAFLHINYQFSPPKYFISFDKEIHVHNPMQEEAEEIVDVDDNDGVKIKKEKEHHKSDECTEEQ